MHDGPLQSEPGVGRAILRGPVLWALVLQVLIVAWQILALLNYDRCFSGHMPTMLDPEYSDSITLVFKHGVISGPFILQFVLVPILILKKAPGMTQELRACLRPVSVLLLALTLFCCLLAVGSAAGTYD